MTLRTPEEYIDSLKDDREVYMMGEKVADVTEHPVLKICIDNIATEFSIQQDPKYRDLAVTKLPETGEEISSLFKIPQNSEDLLRRRELIEAIAVLNDCVPSLSKMIGTDSLNALTIAAYETDKNLKTEYSSRIREYRNYCQQNDLALAGAVTDAKGDRSLRPSKQAHPDYYVRIVDRQKDGIVVRGAKVHITFASYVNELVVVPTRAMTEDDKDYAVAFAVPCSAKGVKFINRPGSKHSEFDFPVSAKHLVLESLVIFDDVFIPWERVFLCGEWQFSSLAANWFGNWHRFTAVSYKGPEADLLLGAARLIAEYNGIAEVPHVREKIVEILCYVQSIRAFGKAAAYECVNVVPGMVCPNTVFTNLGKYYFASNYGKTVESLLDIAGGLTATAPSVRDLENPQTKGYIEKYLGGKDGVPTENRLRLFKLINDFAASGMGGIWPVATLHAEGSLSAQKLTMYREMDVEYYTDLAKRAANIKLSS